jgi:pantetheine-phosphate adenylyltransferase
MIGVYAGSFDPPTFGHINIIGQALQVFPQVEVVVTINKDKNRYLAQKESEALFKEMFIREPRLSVDCCPKDEYLANYAVSKFGKSNCCLVRGIRDASDLGVEAIIKDVTRTIQQDLQPVYFLAGKESTHVSSSVVRSLIGHKGWEALISCYVPFVVARYLVTR